MNKTPQAFKAFRLVHLAMVGGLVMLGIVAIVDVRSGPADRVSEDLNRVLQLAAVLISFITLFFGFRLFKSRLLKLHRDKGNVQARLAGYRTASITWWALMEGPGLLALVSFIITGNYAFFALGVFHLMLLLMFTPRWDNIVLLLGFTPEDVMQL